MGIIFALVLLGGVMAYLSGFFDEKIPIDFSRVVPAAGTGRAFTVKVAKEPLIEQAAGTLRAKVETVISPLITARISSIAVWAGDEVEAGQVLVILDSRELKARFDQVHQAVVAAKAQWFDYRRDGLDRFPVIVPGCLCDIGVQEKCREIRYYPIFDEK